MIILYSTGCPLCKTLEMKLNQAGVSYTKITDTEEMEKLGLQSVPVLSVNGELMYFSDAMKYVSGNLSGSIHMANEENRINEDQHQTGS